MSEGKKGALIALATVSIFAAIGYSMGSKGQRGLPVFAGIVIGLIMSGPVVIAYSKIRDNIK